MPRPETGPQSGKRKELPSFEAAVLFFCMLDLFSCLFPHFGDVPRNFRLNFVPGGTLRKGR